MLGEDDGFRYRTYCRVDSALFQIPADEEAKQFVKRTPIRIYFRMSDMRRSRMRLFNSTAVQHQPIA